MEDVKLLFMDLKDMEANRVHEIELFPPHFVVHGLCNGLILLKDSCSEKLYVANPTTKETISLPSYDYKRYWSRDYWNLVYVPSTKTYKVVELLYDCKLKSTVFHIQTVCASLSDSWRPIKELNRAITHYQSISINGILYVHIGNFREPIVSFDVGNETTIKLFPVSAEHRYKHQKFIDMDGLPTMVCSRHSDFVEFDVWILKDVEWVKHLTFCIPEGLKAYPKYTNVLGSLNNGEVILIEDGNEGRRILIYYVTTKQWKAVDTAATTKTPSKYKFLRGSHINSVISLLKGFT